MFLQHVALRCIFRSYITNIFPYFQEKDGSLVYQTKTFRPKDLFLQDVVAGMRAMQKQRKFAPWEKYIQQGLELLSTQEADYNRPPPETDR